MEDKGRIQGFLVNFVPFLKFRIGVGHVAVTIKKLRDCLPVLLFFLVNYNLLKKNVLLVAQHWTASLVYPYVIYHKLFGYITFYELYNQFGDMLYNMLYNPRAVFHIYSKGYMKHKMYVSRCLM